MTPGMQTACRSDSGWFCPEAAGSGFSCLPPARASLRPWRTHRNVPGKGEGRARTQQLVDVLSCPLYTPGSPQSRPHGGFPPRPPPRVSACRQATPAHSGALHLHPVPLVQDVLQQPVDHVQRLVLLQHNVIGGHVALPLLLHLPGRGDGVSLKCPASAHCSCLSGTWSWGRRVFKPQIP